MIIESENDALASIGDREVRRMTADDDEELGPEVEFNESNRARVPAEVGEYIVDTREDVVIAEDERTAEPEPED